MRNRQFLKNSFTFWYVAPMGRKMSDFQEESGDPKLMLDVTPEMIAKAHSLGDLFSEKLTAFSAPDDDICVPEDAISNALHALEIYAPRRRKLLVEKRIVAFREGTD